MSDERLLLQQLEYGPHHAELSVKALERIRELENALQNLLGVVGMQANGVLREDVLEDALRQCRRALYPTQEKDG